jgi:hypothetical protein
VKKLDISMQHNHKARKERKEKNTAFFVAFVVFVVRLSADLLQALSS